MRAVFSWCHKLALALALALGAPALGCAAPKPASGPTDVLKEYARALDEGRIEAAYALLSEEAQRSLPFPAFERLVKENPEEIKEISVSLLRPAAPPAVTATVTTPSGERLLLIYEGDGWRVDGSAVDLYSQLTPEAAVESFVRAYDNQRYDILMRFVPERELEGLSEQKLRKAWKGEQKPEMDRLTQALKAALPTGRIEQIGDRATFAYGAAGTVQLLRENGKWKIEDL